jgi:hypothetical protein
MWAVALAPPPPPQSHCLCPRSEPAQGGASAAPCIASHPRAPHLPHYARRIPNPTGSALRMRTRRRRCRMPQPRAGPAWALHGGAPTAVRTGRMAARAGRMAPLGLACRLWAPACSRRPAPGIAWSPRHLPAGPAHHSPRCMDRQLPRRQAAPPAGRRRVPAGGRPSRAHQPTTRARPPARAPKACRRQAGAGILSLMLEHFRGPRAHLLPQKPPPP